MCDHYYTDVTIQELHRIRTLMDVRRRLLAYLDDEEKRLRSMDELGGAYRLGFMVALVGMREFVKGGLMPICDNPPEEGEWW